MKSWEATRWVKKIKLCPNGQAITRSEKFLLLTLADYHNEAQGCAWTSEQVLAGDILSSWRHTQRLLYSLERKKLLRVERPSGETNRYFINCEAEATAGRPVLVVSNDLSTCGQPVLDPRHHVVGTHDIVPPPPTTQLCRPTHDTAMSSHPRHSYVVQESIEQIKEDAEGPAPAAISLNQSQKSEGWAESDRWLKDFLDTPACFFIPLGTLDDPTWWDLVSLACRGVEEDFIRDSFAKMRVYLTEQPGKTPGTTGDWKTFVRRWLVRENEWERAKEARRTA